MQLSDLRYTFHTKMQEVQGALLRRRDGPRMVRPAARALGHSAGCLGVLVLLAGVGLMTLLILFTHAALLGIPLLVAGILFTFGAYWSPQRTAEGQRGPPPHRGVPALHRRIGEGARPVRRTEEPVLRVPALRDRLRRDGEVGGCVRRSRRPAAGHVVLVHRVDRVHVPRVLERDRRLHGSTSGTLTSTPPSTSGSSGFSGGGFSGGGAGGGGGGSW